MEIPNKIQDDILEFCRINSNIDIDSFILEILQTGFNIVKYGNSPNAIKPKIVEKIIEKEVIKEIKVSDDSQINSLLTTITKLENDIKNKDNEILQLKQQFETIKLIKNKDIYGE